jgi:hypothetical protein
MSPIRPNGIWAMDFQFDTAHRQIGGKLVAAVVTETVVGAGTSQVTEKMLRLEGDLLRCADRTRTVGGGVLGVAV